jgi:cell division transport system ATP-binding protein
VIRFDRVYKRYPNGREALSAISFDIGAGEMVFLTGRSGAGKSTLLRMINRLSDPTSGRILFKGRDVSALRGAGAALGADPARGTWIWHGEFADAPWGAMASIPMLVVDVDGD